MTLADEMRDLSQIAVAKKLEGLSEQIDEVCNQVHALIRQAAHAGVFHARWTPPQNLEHTLLTGVCERLVSEGFKVSRLRGSFYLLIEWPKKGSQ